MGGHALKNTITKRIDLENYQRIKAHISNELKSEGYVICEIIETPGKDSFGDLDLLYWSEQNSDIRQVITKLFKPNEIVPNGDVCSFDFEQFQIDLIKCSTIQQMTFAKFYFSYGDVGGIIGRICSSYGLKFGHDGLHAVLYDNTVYPSNEFDVRKTHKQILLSENPTQVCEFLGLDWIEYSNGFNNQIQIFEWIMKCKYFNVELFTVFNYDNMRRLKFRPMYIKFIEHIGINKDKIYRGGQFSDNQQPEAIEFFKKSDLVEQVKKELEIKKISHEKFNGNYLVAKGYDGKQIGRIMVQMKKHIEEKFHTNLDNWVYNSDTDSIYKLLDEVINDIKL